jgi:hypothetical protein
MREPGRRRGVEPCRDTTAPGREGSARGRDGVRAVAADPPSEPDP